MNSGSTDIGNLNLVTLTFTCTHSLTHTKQVSETNSSHNKVNNLSYPQVPMA